MVRANKSATKGGLIGTASEYITSQQCLDALEVPMHAENGALFRRLTKIMRSHAWEPIRIKLNGVEGGGVTERARGYQRKTNRLPHPHISEEFPGKKTPPRPMSSARSFRAWRWTAGGLARSVRALVAERDALKEKLETRQCGTSDVAPGPDIGRTGKTDTTQSGHRPVAHCPHIRPYFTVLA